MFVWIIKTTRSAIDPSSSGTSRIDIVDPEALVYLRAEESFGFVCSVLFEELSLWTIQRRTRYISLLLSKNDLSLRLSYSKIDETVLERTQGCTFRNRMSRFRNYQSWICCEKLQLPAQFH
jgi:hypothetical protein